MNMIPTTAITKLIAVPPSHTRLPLIFSTKFCTPVIGVPLNAPAAFSACACESGNTTTTATPITNPPSAPTASSRPACLLSRQASAHLNVSAITGLTSFVFDCKLMARTEPPPVCSGAAAGGALAGGAAGTGAAAGGA